MRFGDYIRDKRRGLEWTQPQAAKQIGIEQSYLSKLESGKSYPSEDVFLSLMEAYALDLSDFKDKVFSSELDRLREISEVRSLIINNEQETRKRVHNWIVSGVIAFSIGGACLGTSLLATDKDIIQFQYKSEGVSPLEGGTDNPEETGNDNPENETTNAAAQEMTRKINEKYQSLEEYKGVVFFETVPDGTRMWRFFGSSTETKRSPLRWFMIPAIALLLGGIGCFFASYRKA